MQTIADHYFSSILDYLQSQGLNNEDALKAINFTEFSNRTKQQLSPRISLKSYNALLNYAQNTLKDPLFGFRLGQHIRTADYGVLGYLVESSNGLSNAIQALLNYDCLVANIGQAQFEQHKSQATIRWFPHAQCNEQVVLRNMTAWVSVVRQLLNNELSPTQVSFQHHFTQAQINTLATWFNCPILTNAKHNEICFPSSYLSLNFKTDNAAIHLALKQVSDQQLSLFTNQQNITENVSQILMAKLDLQNCTLIRTANALSMTPRTLQRHLKLHGTTFALMLENERKRRIKELPNKPNLAQLALLLGFKDQSSFNRAFKRWYSCSPLEYFKTKKG
ncbi:AraC family transcriptional regulator [Pseudoalteromonas marina]|uniref:AraC family transcriptional regulator n=1 Tax=Pseudoalteromonas marina TaxID=267375 RepID=UPI0027356BF5|nr:AraC family transcriptional regulator [Pseudoalteromonas marina]MDP2484158.1 AraC family transcriptional regulator ligand-binding domain-containing protein [Pseudoalteromonas marina]